MLAAAAAAVSALLAQPPPTPRLRCRCALDASHLISSASAPPHTPSRAQPNTRIETSMSLSRGCPARPNPRVVANQSADFACSYVEYEARAFGTYW